MSDQARIKADYDENGPSNGSGCGGFIGNLIFLGLCFYGACLIESCYNKSRQYHQYNNSPAQQEKSGLIDKIGKN